MTAVAHDNSPRSGSRRATLTLSADDLADLKRLLATIVAHTVSTETPAESVFADSSGRGHLLRRARTTLDDRNRRARIFRKGMFGEPAWEMLLALYVSEHGQRESIGSLRDTAGITMTTALRWLDFLEGENLVRRLEHPFDKRRVSIELTDKGREKLDLYFSDTSYSVD